MRAPAASRAWAHGLCWSAWFLLAWHAAASQLPDPHKTGLHGVQFMEAQAVPSAGNRKAMLLPLAMKAGVMKRRKLLRAASLGVEGSVRNVGYFFANVQFGTPPHPFQVIIDTGSTITYVPCADCKECGKHKDAPFNPKTSTTANILSCGTPKCNCGSPACQCVDSKCYYSRTYAEQSSSDGILLEDVFGFPDVPGSAEVAAVVANHSRAADVYLVFGCEYRETGEIYRQRADGIMGLGHNSNALQSQLVAQKVIEDTFALCFGYPQDGVLLLGDVSLTRQDEMVYTPLKPAWQTHYYTLTVDHMSVNGKKVDVPVSAYAQGYGSVLDSGTTFTYLPSVVFKGFLSLLSEHAKSKGLKQRSGQDPQYRDICWSGGPEDTDELGKYFPKVDMVFAGGSTLVWQPLQYLFVSGSSVYCLGVFDNGAQGTLLGGIAVRNVLVQYDRRNLRAGFLPVSSCSEVSTMIIPQEMPATKPAKGKAGVDDSSGSSKGTGSARVGSDGVAEVKRTGSSGTDKQAASEKSRAQEGGKEGDGLRPATGEGQQGGSQSQVEDAGMEGGLIQGGSEQEAKDVLKPQEEDIEDEMDSGGSQQVSEQQPGTSTGAGSQQHSPVAREEGKQKGDKGKHKEKEKAHVIPLGPHHGEDPLEDDLVTLGDIHVMRQRSSSSSVSPATLVLAGILLAVVAGFAWVQRHHLARTWASPSRQQGSSAAPPAAGGQGRAATGLDELDRLIPTRSDDPLNGNGKSGPLLVGQPGPKTLRGGAHNV